MTRAWRSVALALVLVGAVPLVDAGRGQASEERAPETRKSIARTEFVGSASARVAAAGPIAGGLNLEAGFARSTVDLAGEATRGESTTMSTGAAGLFLSLAGAPPVLPEPTRADSNGKADAERSVAAPDGDFVRAGHERAHAEPGRSEAVSRLGELTLGDAAAVFGGSSAASIDAEGSRSSAAVTELRLGGRNGPAVVLSGLAWRAEQKRGVDGEAAFSLGAASIGGHPLVVGSPEHTTAAIEAINGVLAGQGMRISMPLVTAGADGSRVDPLRVELRDPPLNRAVGAAAYSPLAPAVNQAQDTAVQASGSDPRVSQALLGANVALSVLLGNGGAGLELGGAVAGIGTREVPDLGSLFGGAPAGPLSGAPGAESADGAGALGAESSAGSEDGAGGPTGPGGGFLDGGTGSGTYGALPVAAAVPASDGFRARPGSAAGQPPADGSLGNGKTSGRESPERPGRLPAPLAAAALATGLAITGIDWLARRRTVGVVSRLRAAAGLASAAGRRAPTRRSLVAAGLAAVTLFGLALAPSQVPRRSAATDEAAAVSPVPPLQDAVDTGVPGEIPTAPDDPGDGSVPGTPAGSSPQGATGARATTSKGAPAAGRPTGGPAANRDGATANRAGVTGATGGNGPAGSTAAGAVTRGRDCAGGELQDRNSTYSPPCLKFSGDNGGATSKGVTRDTITIAMREPEMIDAGINNQGRISDTPADLKRSLLAYVDYFNRVYQTYGRKVQIVFFKAKTPLLAGAEGGYQEEANADALTVGQEIKAFADLLAQAPSYGDALARQSVIGWGTYHLSKSWYQARAPYAWANLPDCNWIAEQSIDYAVKRLGSSPAKYAGDPAMRSKPRAIGLVVPDSPWYQECANQAEALYRAAGYKFARRVNYPLNFNQSSQTATNVVAQMKAAGVTTVMCMCDPLLPYFATPQANQQNYHPEWLVAGFGATDTDIVGQFYDQSQWSHAFGMGVVGELKSGYESESYRAYKAIRNDEPAQLRDIMYYPVLWFFSCLQMAGPNLTPKTFEAGCFALPARQGEIGLWKFGPGDYTAVSDAREIYWDPQGTSAWNSRKGRYVATLGGQRYSGPWPQGEPAFPPPQ